MPSIFTQIINKNIKSDIVSENENYIAFMDIMPVNKGHVLIVPKLEVDDIFDLSPEIYQGLFNFARKVSIAIKKVIPCERVGMAVVGFEVPHAHIHLIPINNMNDMSFENKSEASKEELRDVSKKISNAIDC